MKKLYSDAKECLLSRIPSDNSSSILDSYLEYPDQSKSPVSLNELYKRLLASAQNSNMKAGVVGGAIGGVDNLGKILFKFNWIYITMFQ